MWWLAVIITAFVFSAPWSWPHCPIAPLFFAASVLYGVYIYLRPGRGDLMFLTYCMAAWTLSLAAPC
ncbi:MAG: hypothetical protein ACK4SY_07695 [Pyrobaculum sp.]